jgi:hypothetical protein
LHQTFVGVGNQRLQPREAVHLYIIINIYVMLLLLSLIYTRTRVRARAHTHTHTKCMLLLYIHILRMCWRGVGYQHGACSTTVALLHGAAGACSPVQKRQLHK